MKKYIIINTTFSKKIEARDFAKFLVEKKFCACAQISKIESFYNWKNKIHSNKEFLLQIKTNLAFYKIIEKEIKNKNSYENPEIISININNISKKYSNWIDSCLKN